MLSPKVRAPGHPSHLCNSTPFLFCHASRSSVSSTGCGSSLSDFPVQLTAWDLDYYHHKPPLCTVLYSIASKYKYQVNIRRNMSFNIVYLYALHKPILKTGMGQTKNKYITIILYSDCPNTLSQIHSYWKCIRIIMQLPPCKCLNSLIFLKNEILHTHLPVIWLINPLRKKYIVSLLSRTFFPLFNESQIMYHFSEWHHIKTHLR